MKYFFLLLLCSFALHIFAQNHDTTRYYVQEANPDGLKQLITDLHSQPEGPLAGQHLPYPIIFVHGWIGSEVTWNEFKVYATGEGLTYGGPLRFDLNHDNDLGYSNLTSLATTDIYSFIGNTTLIAGDFYCIDFNVSATGVPYGGNENGLNQSNQAAILKQGVALSAAISAVLQITGKDKVILFGHSMGGLAIRTYLQNPNMWPADGTSHVAKLITSGTPHYGNNFSVGNVVGYEDSDEYSDAVRDMRRNYSSTNSFGVYMFGGYEDVDVIGTSYHSVDVNCNGIMGNYIEGLNQKYLPDNIEYCCIIGNYLGADGDIVVSTSSADLKTIKPSIHREKFTVGGLGGFHLSLPEQSGYNIYGLDEPDDYQYAYGIGINRVYTGYFTPQGEGSNYPADDWDDYKFNMPQAGYVKAVANGLPNSNTALYLVRATDETYVAAVESNGASHAATSLTWLPAGQYYVELANTPDGLSWNYPYTFEVQTSIPSATTTPAFIATATVSPNPTADVVSLSATFQDVQAGMVSITDATGRLIEDYNFEGSALDRAFDLSGKSAGMYFLTLRTASGTQSWSVVRQ